MADKSYKRKKLKDITNSKKGNFLEEIEHGCVIEDKDLCVLDVISEESDILMYDDLQIDIVNK